MAARQHGLVTHSQLVEMGLTRDAIAHRVDRGHLRRIHRGVFVLGLVSPDPYTRWLAAVLACGTQALLSHRSGAELWEILPRAAGPVEVSVPIGDRHRHRGLIVHRRRTLQSTDRRARHGIPVTSPARTLADIAGAISTTQLETAVNEADKLGLIDPDRLRKALEEMRPAHGVPALRRLLDSRTFRLTDSELERLFLRLVRKARLPLPETRPVVNGYRVDLFWPDLGLVVETDGLRYHRTPAEQAVDRRRDQAHAADGLTVLRFTHEQVRFEAAAVRSVLSRTIARLSAGQSSARRAAA